MLTESLCYESFFFFFLYFWFNVFLYFSYQGKYNLRLVRFDLYLIHLYCFDISFRSLLQSFYRFILLGRKQKKCFLLLTCDGYLPLLTFSSPQMNSLMSLCDLLLRVFITVFLRYWCVFFLCQVRRKQQGKGSDRDQSYLFLEGSNISDRTVTSRPTFSSKGSESPMTDSLVVGRNQYGVGLTTSLTVPTFVSSYPRQSQSVYSSLVIIGITGRDVS